jgi:hypothetical protein
MTIVGKTSEGFLISRITQAGPNPYDATGRPIITFNDFKHRVEEVLSVEIEAEVGDAGAFLAHNAGLVAATRVMTVMVTANAAAPADADVLRELVVGDAINLSTKNIIATAIGR